MKEKQGRFGTFEGVFTPTILTIIGVMMYLRLGWVVGNAGFGGAVLIIVLAKLVTISTGLSIASMATNVKIGHGGSYAFISRSLGTEVGSAIGIPLYLSQALGGALYIVGFSEGWLSIFPTHCPQTVGSIALLFLFIVAFFSAKIAMKVQYVIMSVVALSLVSFFLGKGDGAPEIVLWGGFENAPFWVLFAVFFPAVTGIEAGISMSGDLKDPSRSLPIGILAAIMISMGIYVSVAYLFDRLATSEQLIGNYTIVMTLSRWKVLVVAGVLGATLSSALGVIVASPRILMSLARDKVIPLSRVFRRLSKNGEPRNAIIFTGVFIEIALLLGDLNTIAPLMTMFFLITYGTINFAVLIEKSIGIPSFRPSFNPPRIVPLIGGTWCFVIMFIINPVFAAIALSLICVVYVIQLKRELNAPFGDVRSGLFTAIAEWAAKKSASMPRSAKTWRPNLMIPIEDPKSWTQLIDFVRDIVFPGGTIRSFSVRLTADVVNDGDMEKRLLVLKQQAVADSSSQDHTADELQSQLDELLLPVKQEGIFTAAMAVEAYDFLEGMSIITQVMRGMFFPPNVAFLTMSMDTAKDWSLDRMVRIAIGEKLGIMVLALHAKAGFGKKETINIWLRSRSPNRNLAILTALQLKRNWDCSIRLFSVEANQTDQKKTEDILHHIVDYARMPVKTEVTVYLGNFNDVISAAPTADLNIFGASKDLSARQMHTISEMVNTSCLFIRDSGEESALA